ncbi:BbrUII/HgiDII family restriction enzyme [Halobacterium noricense]|uniref:BbrUII/HgiDII family restriction enzyme n=1 Tax=Halobacterium noricense TaxID=223182 RepID=UPI001E2AA346|nr:ATP-binding protein [Halobacterium noricense]UHH25105.1 ATP-binding protein [Halobacterium noricense]
MSQPEPKSEPSTDYELSLSLNVLNHLGLNLYSNVPAVLSEAVANAWDADAERVEVNIDTEGDRIEIVDDGHGMDAYDVNHRYLHVGYRRREDEGRSNRTPKHGRPVMGRKGIGKLSLFSIANTVEVYTSKDGEQHAFRMNVDEIKEAISEEEEDGGRLGDGRYQPTALDTFPDDLEEGTKIVLKDLKKRLRTAESALRKRLARRFGIIGPDYNFEILVNDEPVKVTDRDYFHKVQFLWTFDGDEYRDYCRDSKLEEHEKRPATTEDGHEIRGWIGTVEQPSDLVEDYPGRQNETDDLNKISLLVRGKMAKPDLLEDFNDGRMYTKYLVGEIHADFLDYDDETDIATSNREDIVQEDPRYQDLRDFLRVQLNHIASRWNELRNSQGAEEARSFGPIDMWFESLSPENRERAQRLFGKINQITVEDDDERRELFKHGVLAFENLKYKENLDRLDDLTADADTDVSRTFDGLDDVESTQLDQMATQRAKAIDAIQVWLSERGWTEELSDIVRERPWLLNPAWTQTARADSVGGVARIELDDVGENSPLHGHDDVIAVKQSDGLDLVAFQPVDFDLGNELLERVQTYEDVLEHAVAESNSGRPPGNVVVVVPEDTRGDFDGGFLERMDAVVHSYEDLLAEAKQAYERQRERDTNAGRVTRLVQDIESGDAFE